MEKFWTRASDMAGAPSGNRRLTFTHHRLLGAGELICGGRQGQQSGSDAGRDDTPPYDDTHSSVLASVEAHDRFLDLLTATGCEVAVDANASEPSFLQYSKRTEVVRGRSGVQWTFGSLGKKNP